MTTIQKYDDIKRDYEAFLEDLPESEFVRYSKELKYLKNLVKLAPKRLEEAKIYRKKLEETIFTVQKLGFRVVS